MPILIPSVNVSIEAEVKQGKTTFAMTGPLPTVSFQWDQGVEGGLFGEYSNKVGLLEGVEVEILNYLPSKLDEYIKKIQSIPPNGILVFNLPSLLQLDPVQYAGCTEMWKYAEKLLWYAQHTEQVATIVEDTMTAARELAAASHLEDSQHDRNVQILAAVNNHAKAEHMPSPRLQLIQIEWAKPNDMIKDRFSSTKGSGKNLIATHHLTDEREKKADGQGRITEVLTGRRTLQGYNKTYAQIDIAIRLGRERRKNVANQYEDMVIGTFIWCRYNLALEGEEIVNPSWDKLMNYVSNQSGGRLVFPMRGT